MSSQMIIPTIVRGTWSALCPQEMLACRMERRTNFDGEGKDSRNRWTRLTRVRSWPHWDNRRRTFSANVANGCSRGQIIRKSSFSIAANSTEQADRGGRPFRRWQ
jgi:hypothetical protein